MGLEGVSSHSERLFLFNEYTGDIVRISYLAVITSIGFSLMNPFTAAANPTSGTLSGTVTLSASIAGKASPEDTLFIFARSTEGPPMPRAITVKKVKDLPVSFLLTDGMGARPDLKISNVPQLIITARISKSGKAMPESGDLRGSSQIVKPGDKNISIVIDQQIP
jgi:cytochrome c-type biogenesis protein CcmH